MCDWYDTKRLFSDADARIIVKNLFNPADFRKSGSTLFCRCPSGHKETRLDHCAVYKSGCKCFSCGSHYTTKEMVEIYFNETSFPDICGRIADAIGGRENYLIKPDTKNKKPVMPVTREEMEIVGIYSPEGRDVPTITKLFEDDRKSCIALIRERAKEMKGKYTSLLLEENNPDLREELERRLSVTECIIKKLPGVA